MNKIDSQKCICEKLIKTVEDFWMKSCYNCEW